MHQQIKPLKPRKQKTFRQKIEENWRSPNKAILQHLENTAVQGYPTISNWSDFIQGKDEVEVYSTLAYYILTKKVAFAKCKRH